MPNFPGFYPTPALDGQVFYGTPAFIQQQSRWPWPVVMASVHGRYTLCRSTERMPVSVGNFHLPGFYPASALPQLAGGLAFTWGLAVSSQF